MKKYNLEELMIPERKFVQAQRPKPGEFAQGIGFCVLTALQHLRSAQILNDKKENLGAFNLLVLGIEELGKVNSYADMLVSWNEPDKITEFKEKQKKHTYKIKKSLAIFSKLLSLESTTISAKLTVQDKVIAENPPLELILQFFAPEAAEKYHQLRLNSCYTDFKDGLVSSPKWAYDEVQFQIYFAFAKIVLSTLEKIIELVNKFLPIYMEPINECYECSDPERIKTLKREINRRVERTIPAIRKTMVEFMKEKHNKDINLDDVDSEAIKNANLDKDTMIKQVKKISELIISKDNIEEIYIYPPLKDWAKEYYKTITPHL